MREIPEESPSIALLETRVFEDADEVLEPKCSETAWEGWETGYV